MQDTPWEYSDVEDYSQIPPTEGERFLLIEATRRNMNGKYGEAYEIDVQDLQTMATYTLSWNMTTSDSNGNIMPNNKAKGTLVSLKKALYGPEARGIPNAEAQDIVGCVVCGIVTVKEAASGRIYARVYQFKPVSSDWAVLGLHPEQYVTDSTPIEGYTAAASETQDAYYESIPDMED